MKKSIIKGRSFVPLTINTHIISSYENNAKEKKTKQKKTTYLFIYFLMFLSVVYKINLQLRHYYYYYYCDYYYHNVSVTTCRLCIGLNLY